MAIASCDVNYLPSQGITHFLLFLKSNFMVERKSPHSEIITFF